MHESLLLDLEEGVVMGFRKGWQAELVIVWVAEVFLGEDFSIVLETILGDTIVAGLNLLPLVLLRNDILLHSGVNDRIILTAVVRLHRVQLFLLVCPVLHRAIHRVLLETAKVFILATHVSTSVQSLMIADLGDHTRVWFGFVLGKLHFPCIFHNRTMR